MKKIAISFLFFCGALFSLGAVFLLKAGNAEYVDEHGWLHDSGFLPAGVALIIAGFLGILFVFVINFIRRLRRK